VLISYGAIDNAVAMLALLSSKGGRSISPPSLSRYSTSTVQTEDDAKTQSDGAT